MKTGLSAALTCGGAVFSKMIKLRRLHFSDIAKDVVAAASVCFNSAAVCYFWGAVLCLLYPQETENVFFPLLETYAEVRRVERRIFAPLQQL